MASDETTDGISDVDGQRGAVKWTTPSSSSSSSSLRQHRRDGDDDDYDYDNDDNDFKQNNEMTHLLTARRRRTPAYSNNNHDTDNQKSTPHAALKFETIQASAKSRQDWNLRERSWLLINFLLLATLLGVCGTEERTSSALKDDQVCLICSGNIFQEKGHLLQDGLTLTGSTTGALTVAEDSPALACAPTFSMQSKVLYHKLHGDGNCYAVSTDGSSFEVVLGLLVGNLCDATDCQIFHNGFDSHGGSSASTLFLEADQGQEYWLVVGGFGAQGENYVVQFESRSCSPTNSPTISEPPSVMPTDVPSTTPSVLPTTTPTSCPTFAPTVNVWRPLGAFVDGDAGDSSGWSVALSSDGYTVAIGARYNSDKREHVRVLRYELSTGQWNQQGRDILGEAAGDQFGRSVALAASVRTPYFIPNL